MKVQNIPQIVMPWTLRILEAVRILGLKDKTKIYQASTSELYGKIESPQNEATPLSIEVL